MQVSIGNETSSTIGSATKHPSKKNGAIFCKILSEQAWWRQRNSGLMYGSTTLIKTTGRDDIGMDDIGRDGSPSRPSPSPSRLHQDLSRPSPSRPSPKDSALGESALPK